MGFKEVFTMISEEKFTKISLRFFRDKNNEEAQARRRKSMITKQELSQKRTMLTSALLQFPIRLRRHIVIRKNIHG
jgi:hypothetical protein